MHQVSSNLVNCTISLYIILYKQLFHIYFTYLSSIKDGDDYVVGLQLPHSLNLTDLTPQTSFFVYSINDAILEDYEEDFTISISLDNPNVLADIDTSKIEITILDNEGYYTLIIFATALIMYLSITVLRFTFNQPSFVISESVQGTHIILVTIENFDSVIIPQDVSITISAVVDGATSNATQGNALGPLFQFQSTLSL